VTALELNAKRPDEAQQLSAYGGNDLLFCLTARQQRSVSRMQAMLRPPGDRFDRLAARSNAAPALRVKKLTCCGDLPRWRVRRALRFAPAGTIELGALLKLHVI
jgi:hypothetical protein